MDFLNGMAALLAYQLLGTVLVMLLGLSIPGPVLGMLLLFATLLVSGKIPHWLGFTAEKLLFHLSLLFVPAGVGVIAHLQRIGSEWLPIVATLFFGTLVSMAVTVVVMQQLVRLMPKKDKTHE